MMRKSNKILILKYKQLNIKDNKDKTEQNKNAKKVLSFSDDTEEEAKNMENINN